MSFGQEADATILAELRTAGYACVMRLPKSPAMRVLMLAAVLFAQPERPAGRGYCNENLNSSKRFCGNCVI